MQTSLKCDGVSPVVAENNVDGGRKVTLQC